ncbi:MAG: HNH endonuclease [Gemmatimonadaceae bacterium]
MIDWRLVEPLLGWFERRPSQARASLNALWFGESALEARFRAFAGGLHGAGISQPGAQLSIASTLLMGLSAKEHPPIRTERFAAVFAKVDYPPFLREYDAAARYLHALRFLDQLIDLAPRYGLQLRHRLDAQGIVWSVGGGWRGPADFGQSPASGRDDDLDDTAVLRLIQQRARDRVLTTTEKLALVLSRRGQGQFRDDLIALWGKCAVTGCRDTRLLRASHLKPWKQSTNPERLDPFNGLLLTPHLDTALDCGIITFKDSGTIQLSPGLSAADSKSLGLRRAMKLGYVDRRHRAYLKFHREHVFQE